MCFIHPEIQLERAGSSERMTLSNTNNNANNSFVHYTTSALTIVHAYILEAAESDSGIDFHIHSSANTVRVIGISECYKFPAASAPLP